MSRMLLRCRLGVFLLGLAAVGSALSTAPAQPPAPPPVPSLGKSLVDPAAPPPADELRDTLTETVGMLAGLQLYQTYLNIGFLADARAEGLYEASQLTQLLGSVVVPLDKVDKQLDKLSKLPLSADDKAAVARLRKINALLRVQGVELQGFWDTGAEERGKKYETARKAVWAELNELLDLEGKSDEVPAPRAVPPKKP